MRRSRFVWITDNYVITKTETEPIAEGLFLAQTVLRVWGISIGCAFECTESCLTGSGWSKLISLFSLEPEPRKMELFHSPKLGTRSDPLGRTRTKGEISMSVANNVPRSDLSRSCKFSHVSPRGLIVASRPRCSNPAPSRLSPTWCSVAASSTHASILCSGPASSVP